MHTIRKQPVARRDRCAGWRRELIQELCGLSDLQLKEIGVWRSAVPAAADEILAGRGCSLEGQSG